MCLFYWLERGEREDGRKSIDRCRRRERGQKRKIARKKESQREPLTLGCLLLFPCLSTSCFVSTYFVLLFVSFSFYIVPCLSSSSSSSSSSTFFPLHSWILLHRLSPLLSLFVFFFPFFFYSLRPLSTPSIAIFCLFRLLVMILFMIVHIFPPHLSFPPSLTFHSTLLNTPTSSLLSPLPVRLSFPLLN